MLAFRSVQQSDHCAREEFLYELKAGPAGGLRPPSGPATTRRSPGNRAHPARNGNDNHKAGAGQELPEVDALSFTRIQAGAATTP